MDVKFVENIRSDEKGRRVRVQFITRDGKLNWIRITTFFENGTKFRVDYYRDEDPDEFEQVRKREKKLMEQRTLAERNRNAALYTTE